jgi:hypothetical protein
VKLGVSRSQTCSSCRAWEGELARTLDRLDLAERTSVELVVKRQVPCPTCGCTTLSGTKSGQVVVVALH